MNLSTAQKNVIVFLASIFLVAATLAALAFARWSSRPNASRGVTVADSAQVKVTPDTAYIQFGIVNKDKSSKKAASVNAKKTSAVVNALKKAGILKSDIKTIDYSLNPEMDWNKTPEVIVGYTASNTVRVRTKAMDKIGNLMDAAISAGSNTVQDISFDVEDKRKLRQRALTLAVKKCESKAEAIANALGCKLGPATTANESVDMYFGDSRNAVMEASVVKYRRSTTPIEPGETTVSAQVKIVYSLN